MVIKSLTITEDAYNVLKRNKRGDESFSEVILRVGKKAPDLDKYFGILKHDTGLSSRIKKRRELINAEAKRRADRWARMLV